MHKSGFTKGLCRDLLLSCPLPPSYCQVISLGPMTAGAIVLLPLYVTRQPMTHATLTKSIPANASPVRLSPMSITSLPACRAIGAPGAWRGAAPGAGCRGYTLPPAHFEERRPVSCRKVVAVLHMDLYQQM